MALTEALRKRSQGLRKKSSVSDQYLYTPVFRPSASTTTTTAGTGTDSSALFGPRQSRLQQQTTIKERRSEEQLNENEAENETSQGAMMTTSGRSEASDVTTTAERYHSYTALDITKIDMADYEAIKLSHFIPGRIPVCLRQLRPGTQYVAMVTAVNQCGESEAVVMQFKTADATRAANLELDCRLKSTLQLCTSHVKHLLNVCFLALGLGLYAFLILYLFSEIVTDKVKSAGVAYLTDVSASAETASSWTESYTGENSWIDDVANFLTGDV